MKRYLLEQVDASVVYIIRAITQSRYGYFTCHDQFRPIISLTTDQRIIYDEN